MLQFIARRLALALVTLLLLSVIVFSISNVLPQNVGRSILGPFASQETVDALNHRLGTDRPRLEQYLDLLKGMVTFDFGESYRSGAQVGDMIKDTLANSAKLAILALLITVPLGILGGTVAALRQGTLIDRAIVMIGLAGSSIPEFVTATFLVVVLGLQLDLLPTLATWPRGANIFTQIHYLLMPALALVLVYFGYIARMARAGMIVALESDYTRTAIMKGMPRGQVIRKHVLRNALLPTIAVIATSTGYLFGGLLAVELIFNINGLGRLLVTAAKSKDLPVLQAGVIVIGVIYMFATLIADIVISWLNPRIRLGSEG
ncbi:MAG: peptide/nickel transport system permease protein [Gaiellales bacterium]|jgi:peptide/nickel transport system permease protein|nr:peptide/nickel transport system permease protein [Gaiellales bacterium]MDX6593653.1 peptide/nickel transport system permease protein [Gaiellales bacterium]